MLESILKLKKVFIFDLDGTLIDSVGVWNKIDHKLLEDLGNVSVPEDIINLNRDYIIGSSTSGAPYEDYILYLIDKYKLNKTKEELYAYRRSIMTEILEKQVSVRPYAKEVIELLKKLGMTLVLATTTTRTNLNTYCYDNPYTKDLDIMNNFSLILTSEDVKSFKPNPEIFEKVLNQLSLKREDVVVIEDSIVGVTGAVNANLDCIAVKEEHSKENKELIKEKANVYIESLEEIYEYLKKKELGNSKK